MLKTTDTGSIIAELRKEAGYTQKTLAEVLHITDKAISKWERGICQPDSSLLPKLSLLLGADIALLVSSSSIQNNNWIGLIDLQNYDIDLSEKIYDKPMVYYMLSHFLLLNIKEIYICTSPKNEDYLSDPLYEKLGFVFTFDFVDLPKCNVMILNKPLFLFGADISRQFQGAMATNALVKMIPVNQNETFLFCPSEYSFMYLKNAAYLYDTASERTEGRGVICIELTTIDSVADAATFVRLYQMNSGLLIASLEEIAFRKGLIDKEYMLKLSKKTMYGDKLRSIADEA